MNPQQKIWKVASVVGILLAIFLGIISLKELKSIDYVGKSDQIVNTISVNGKGEVNTKPDVATFSFSVSENATTVVDAQTNATNKINAALKVVRDAGVADKDIDTSSYSINPHYEYQSYACPNVYSSSVSVPCRPSKNVLTGYDVGETITVKVRDLNKAGALFTSIGALNVQYVNSLSFSIDKPDTVKAQARDLAIKDAESKANTLAKQLGVSLVRITGYFENGDQTYPVYGMGVNSAMVKSDAAVAPVPEIPAGDQKVTSNVTVTYEIQ